jgi:hypothetical protein
METQAMKIVQEQGRERVKTSEQQFRSREAEADKVNADRHKSRVDQENQNENVRKEKMLQTQSAQILQREEKK